MNAYDLPLPSLGESPSSPRTRDTIQVTLPAEILKKVHTLPLPGTVHDKAASLIIEAVEGDRKMSIIFAIFWIVLVALAINVVINFFKKVFK